MRVVPKTQMGPRTHFATVDSNSVTRPRAREVTLAEQPHGGRVVRRFGDNERGDLRQGQRYPVLHRQVLPLCRIEAHGLERGRALRKSWLTVGRGLSCVIGVLALVSPAGERRAGAWVVVARTVCTDVLGVEPENQIRPTDRLSMRLNASKHRHD